jgi:hypothetical protein
MATTRPDMPAGTTRGGYTEPQYSGGAVGVTAFAGILMVMGGVFHFMQGLIALIDDKFYVVGKEYVFELDLTTWGWVHLITGILVAAAGMALFSGQLWARTIGVILACASMLASFAWLPHYPIWSLVVITFDGFVIWALTMHGRDIART